MSRKDWSARVAANARASLLSNVMTVLVSLAAVPLTLRALGTEGYGTFQVLISLAGLAVMADVGLGLALLTRVGQLGGAQQHHRIREAVGGALMVISVVTVALTAAGFVALRTGDLPAYLKVPESLRQQTQNGCYVVLAAFAIRMPLSVFSSAHAGMQITHRLIKWSVGGNVLASIAMIVVATVSHRLDLTLAVQSGISLLGMIGAARLGCRLEPATKPMFAWRHAAVGWSLLRSGLLYYVLQLEVVIIGSIDNLVIAKVLGVQAVAVYSIAQRLISLAFSMVYSLGSSFWGGVAHAMGTGDVEWIRTEATRLRRLGTLWMAVIAGGFAAVGAPVIALWTGGRLQVDPWLTVALGAYFAFLGHTMIDASILNGAEKIRQQVVTVGMDALLNLGASLWLAHRIGYVGVGLGTLVAYLTCTFLPLQLFSWKLVVKGARPPFWTRSLSTMVVSIVMGVLLNRLCADVLHLRPLAATLLGGTTSLLVTLALVRILTGREGLETLRNSFHRSGRVVAAPGGQAA